MVHNESLETAKNVISNFVSMFNNFENSSIKVFVFVNLFKEIERELNRFIAGRVDLTLTSIQVRNLFELYLITKHIYDSDEGLDEWLGQMHQDTIEIQNGFIGLLRNHHKDISELEEVKNFTDQSLNESPYVCQKKYFNMGVLAGQYGYKNEHLAMHKLCSKLIHPTSIKVNGYSALSADNNYLSILEIFGVFVCGKIEELSYEIADSIKSGN
ncbi:hypothetical protein [Sulfurospirillum oryzae]|uniref:hypothetical protein n=1 Tax=Sulfurospirillum oryzae TaxID=2976535 RepID=UPI0021E99717|nr:hypothetical protein [Sulfurospirillum oryzae]